MHSQRFPPTLPSAGSVKYAIWQEDTYLVQDSWQFIYSYLLLVAVCFIQPTCFLHLLSVLQLLSESPAGDAR
jgi:hypothetical protein